jgi:sugar phosphate isomerase/epimerase
MCFDLGHAHAYSNEHQLFEKYKNKIQCSHLHNNNGKDSHSRLTEGQIDYKYFAKALLKIENCSNCLECFPPFGAKLSLQEFSNFVKNCFDDVCSI